MNSFYAFLYSIILFIILIFISIYIIKQVVSTQLLEKKIKILQQDKKQVGLNPEDLYKLGQLYLQKRLFYKSLILLGEALEKWDLNDRIGLASLINTIGFTYFKLRKYTFSIYYYKIAITIIPDYILALKNLAFVYESKKSFDKAYECYSKCFILEPKNRFFETRVNLMNRKLILNSTLH